jgi:YggT family protein
MGGGYITNAGVFIVDIVLGLYTFAVLLRFVLQLVRADFYNPLCQAIVTITNPPLKPLRRYIPSFAGIDTSSVLLLLMLQMLNTLLVMLMLGLGFGVAGLVVSAVAELVSKTIYLFLFAIFIQVIVSWIAPGSYNPILALLDSLTNPLLRPARRLIPPVGGLDLSPMAAIIVLYLALMLIAAPLRDFGRMLM